MVPFSPVAVVRVNPEQDTLVIVPADPPAAGPDRALEPLPDPNPRAGLLGGAGAAPPAGGRPGPGVGPAAGSEPAGRAAGGGGRGRGRAAAGGGRAWCA